MWKGFAALALTAVLTACASSGKDFKAKNVEQLVPGESTVSDAAQNLGAEPLQTVFLPDGGRLVIWRYIQSSGLSGKTEIKEAQLIFDAQGHYVRPFQMTNTQ